MTDVKTKSVDRTGRRAVFLDRDGTLIEERHYLHEPDEVVLLPGAIEGLRRLRDLGLALVVVTNQSGIGRGYYDADALSRVHTRLIGLLAAEGVRLDGLYACPHTPEDGCACRKPRPGLVEQARRELGLAPAGSFVIGDKACDIVLGQAIGAVTVLVTTGYGAQTVANGSCRPDYVAADLGAAARIIETLLAGPAAGRAFRR